VHSLGIPEFCELPVHRDRCLTTADRDGGLAAACVSRGRGPLSINI
jgi:hypothetical protein